MITGKKLLLTHLNFHTKLLFTSYAFYFNYYLISGRNPLHLAARGNYTQTVELLHSVHSHLLDQVDKDGVIIFPFQCDGLMRFQTS